MGKTTTKEIPSDRREDTSSIPSLSRDDENISQGEDFSGHLSQSQISSSDNFGFPVTHGNQGQVNPVRINRDSVYLILSIKQRIQSGIRQTV